MGIQVENADQLRLEQTSSRCFLSRKILKPTNTPRVFHVEYTWCICNSLGNSLQ